jgi:uncharacterized membrane protein YtjA (UPF0391 family)
LLAGIARRQRQVRKFPVKSTLLEDRSRLQEADISRRPMGGAGSAGPLRYAGSPSSIDVLANDAAFILRRCGTRRDRIRRNLSRAPRFSSRKGTAMSLLKWALIFLVVSIIAGLLGFTGISAASADIARVLFYIFVVIFLVLLILGLTVFRA